jgi:hypothetical protein
VPCSVGLKPVHVSRPYINTDHWELVNHCYVPIVCNKVVINSVSSKNIVQILSEIN